MIKKMFYSNKGYGPFFNVKLFLFLVFLFLFQSNAIYAQQDHINGQVIGKNLNPSEKWEDLVTLLKNTDFNKTKEHSYGDSLIRLAEKYFPASLAEAHLIVGEYHFNKDQLDKSIIALQEGLKHLEQSNNQLIEMQINRCIGNIFYRQNQYNKARNYFTKSLNLAKTSSDTMYLALGHLGIANTYVDQLNFDSSSHHIYIAKDLALAANLSSQLPSIYSNIVFQEDERGNFEIARSYIYKLLMLAKKSDDLNALFLAYGNLGYSYGKYDLQYDSAIYYLKHGLEYFDPKHSETESLPEFYLAISDNYNYLGRKDSALHYLQKYIRLHDSIQLKQFNKSVQEIEAKYQTEEKEKQLVQAQLEAERQSKLRQLTITLTLGIAILLFALFQIFRNRQKLLRQETLLSLKHKQAEAQQLKELDQLKSNFFANISHEFRTPLTLILGPLEQLKNNQLKGNIQSYASMMQRNALRLKELIDQLLDLSKLESGQMHLDLKDGDIFQFTRQIVGSFESWAKQKNLDYISEIPNTPLWVQYDKDKYEKILSNLISNAIKYTPDKGYIKIRLEAEENDGSIKIKAYVKDSGIGIIKDDQDKIFQRFYQSNYNSEGGKASSGIGLALTKELIELYEGKIWINNNIEIGTQFNFEFSLSQASNSYLSTSDCIELNHIKIKQDSSLKAGNIETDVFSVNHKNKPMVLVVEDNEEVRNYIVEQLNDQHQILQAANGKEGLDIAMDKIPDLVITDLMMPVMSGHELTNQLKTDQITSHIPIIMLTAKVGQEDKLKGLETGADDYLIKPFNAAELQLRVRNLIKQRQLLKERFSKAGNLLSPKEIAVNSVDEKFLNRLLEFLELEIANEQLSVEGLASMIGMSRSQLHRKLKALVEKTPNAFIRSFRMQRAHQLLSQKAGTSSEIAFMVGFNSVAYFSKCFKDEFGLSPSDVLKINI